MNRVRSLLSLLSLSLVALLLAAPVVLAQEAEEEPRETSVTEEVKVRLVELSVVAYDKDGNPITDLKPEDIEVRARGDQMRVAFVERVYEEGEPEVPLPEVRLHLEAPGAVEPVSTTKPKKPHYFIFFVDVENDDKLLRPHAISEISRFISQKMRPEDYAAVVAYNGKIHTEIGFTNQLQLISEGITRAYARPPRPQITKRRRIEQLIDQLEDCGRTVNDGIADTDTSCVRDIGRIYAEELRPNTLTFLDALSGVVRYAGGLDGRATVFAVSHGVAVNPMYEFMEAVRALWGDTRLTASMQLQMEHGEGARHEIDKLMQLAAGEGVTFYFIDRSTEPAGLSGARQRSYYESGARPISVAYQQPQRDMGELSGATGGTFVKNKSPFKALETAMNRERGRYAVGFYVSELLNREDLKRIKVKAQRKGVRLNSGRGSYVKKRTQASIPGTIQFGPTRLLKEETGRFIPFRISVSPRLLGYEAAGNSVGAQLTVHFVVETAEGRPVTDAYHFLSHSYPISLWTAGKEEPLMLEGWLEAPDGGYRLIAVLRNARNGAGGRIVREIKVVSSTDAARATGAPEQ